MEDPHLQLTAKHGPHRLKGRPLIRIEGDHLRNPVPKAHAPPVEAHHLAPPVVTHHYLFLVATPLKLRALLINLYQLRPAKHRLLEAGQPTSVLGGNTLTPGPLHTSVKSCPLPRFALLSKWVAQMLVTTRTLPAISSCMLPTTIAAKYVPSIHSQLAWSNTRWRHRPGRRLVVRPENHSSSLLV